MVENLGYVANFLGLFRQSEDKIVVLTAIVTAPEAFQGPHHSCSVYAEVTTIHVG